MTTVQADGVFIVVAVDGPSGVGKSSSSRLLADKLGVRYVDTGAMYRGVAVAASRGGVDLDDPEALESFFSSLDISFDPEGLCIFVGGEDLSDSIRTPEAAMLASKAAANPGVRERLVTLQREMAAGGGVVMEGRDIGTVVLEDADIKFFLVASGEVRAARRHLDFKGNTGSDSPDIAKVASDIDRRDAQDSTREHSPLVKAPDAITVDTGAMDLEGVVDFMLERIKERL